MHQYFGYIRVSTAKQGEKGVSLQEQRDAIAQYAERFGLEIDRWFEEQETAAKRGRPVFNEMLRLLRQKKSRGVIIHKIDRSARNLRDWADLGEMIDSGIEVHFANESLDLHTRGGRLSADIQAVVAADYIRNLREETKKGLYGRLKQGIYPLGAPMGYLDQGKGGKLKAIDPERAPLVIQAFELYATGKYSLPSLLEELDRRGLRNKKGGLLSLNGISVLLQNPFYVGLMRIKKTNELFPGNHPPLVSKALFDRVQQVLQGKTVDRQTRHNFTFRRMIRCTCSYSLIGEMQKGHVYYRCHTSQCPTTSIREEDVEAKIAEVLSPLHLDPAELGYANAWVRHARLEQETIREHEIANCKLLIDQNRTRRIRLTDAFLDGSIEKELFEERKAGLLLEETSLKERLASLEQHDANALARLGKFLELARTASLLYKHALSGEKRDLVKQLTSNLSATGKIVSAELTIPAQLIANREKNDSCALERGRPRTGGEPRTLEGTLRKLLEHFLREPALEN
jgi:site-specific DNA recombinase